MSDGKRKLSGSQFREIRLKREASLKKQAVAFQTFFKDNSRPGTSEKNQDDLDSVEAEFIKDVVAPTKQSSSIFASSSTQEPDSVDGEVIKDVVVPTEQSSSISAWSSSTQEPDRVEQQEDEEKEAKKVENASLLQMETDEERPVDLALCSDPGLWPEYISDAERICLSKAGPASPMYNFDFPTDTSGRRFTSNNYTRDLNNGEKNRRNWLVYSVAKDSVFCFYCKIFATATSSSLAKDGYRDWRHIVQTLKNHETTKKHFEAQKSWLELSIRLKTSQTIDATSQRFWNAETQHWNAVFQRVVSIVKLLGESCLAFRGSNENLYEHDNGIFLKLVQLLAEFDPVMEEHVRRALNKQHKITTYLSKTIQNEVIHLIAHNVKSHILDEVKKSKYYSIILDCTPDLSKTEQMTFVLRYVSIVQEDINIHEHFLGFLPIERSTSQQLFQVLLQELENLGLPLENMRGQGYDNGANMKGEHAGVQAKIRDINPRAFFIPCGSHSLNLVVNDMAKSSLEGANFFNIVQKLYLFFSSSTFRWAIFLKHVEDLTLKPLSDTRWESRIDAIKPLRYQIGQIYDALLSIYENTDIDSSIRDEASGLLTQIQKFKFLCSVVIWYEVLNHINPISKLMQGKNYDIALAIQLLENSSRFFNTLRSDDHFNAILVDAGEMASEIDADKNFEAIPRHRVRRRKRQFDYENQDEPIIDAQEKYKIEFFFHLVDTAINSLEKRFSQLQHHNSYFCFLYNIYELKDVSSSVILANCKDLETILTDGESSDINSLELCDEIAVVCSLMEKDLPPLEVLKLITKMDFAPNLSIALRILLTLPISVASGERSFSKLKIIKNYLRTTTSQTRLSDLAILGIEYELSNNLDVSQLIKEFSELKVRKKKICMNYTQLLLTVFFFFSKK